MYKLTKEDRKIIDNIKLKLEPTKKRFIRILTKTENNLEVWDSKFGGMPYLPKDSEYPRTEYGEYLFLLAQIYLEDLPESKYLPSSGILQFFINKDWDMSKDTFKVRYYKKVIKNKKKLNLDFSFLPNDTKLPLENMFKLNFVKDYEFLPIHSDEFEVTVGLQHVQQINEVLRKVEYDEKFLREQFDLRIFARGHKIGGYAFHIQDHIPVKRKLLLQIGSQMSSTGQYEICWGDVGVGHFYIKETDLINLKFNRVTFSWECS